jgi:hypothetical protein
LKRELASVAPREKVTAMARRRAWADLKKKALEGRAGVRG